MAYSINIEYSFTYELIISFYAYIYQKKLKSNELGLEWVVEAKKELPSHFAKELEDERWEVLHRIALLVHQCPEKTPEKFLEWFKDLPPGEIYERLSPWVDSIPINLGELRDRSAYLLSEWNEHYFKKLDPKILERLHKEAANRLIQLQNVSPLQLVEEVTNGFIIEPTENVQKVILIPQYHCSPSVVIDFFRGVVNCLYPIHLEHSNPSIVTMSQSLSDERRVKILGFVAKKPRTLIEIHKYMGLAKSTVHHHLVVLRRAGMIRAHFVDNSTVSYYSLRDHILEKFTDELTSLLKGKADEKVF